LQYECAIIHEQGKLIKRAWRGFKLQGNKVEYIRKKREYVRVFKAFKHWRGHTLRQSAFNMIKNNYNHQIKGKCFQAIK
jgi:hypothetical protein